jgi:Rod binding domain-containing protein
MSTIVPLTSIADTLQIARASAEGRQNKQVDGAATLTDTAREFEAVFASLLLKEMRNSVDGGLFPGDKSDSFGSLFDLHLGRVMAEAGFLHLDRQFQVSGKDHNHIPSREE